MRIALLISGYSRSLKNNISNIKKYIMNENEVDVFIHITNKKEMKYMNDEISIDEIKRELSPKVIIVSDDIVFHETSIINNVLNQNYKFYWLNQERKKFEKNEKNNYQVIVKFRPDVCINNKIIFENFDLNTINIPSDSKIDNKKLLNKNDKYLCDIFAFGNSKTMDLYFDFYCELNVLIGKYGTINETLLYFYLNENNIKYNLIDIDYAVILSVCNTIAITGDSGSGKTTISKIIKKLFDNSFVLECDRYHKWERGDENWSKYTHLNPEANYIAKMNTDVFDLKIGKNIYQIDYDHTNGKFTDKKIIESKDNIIICGLHTLYISENILNIKIYMDTDDNLRIPLKIKRDISKRGYSIDKIYNQIKDREEDYKEFILPQKKNADIIISLFTDKKFDIESFDIDNELKVYFKVGINTKHNLNKILCNLKFSNIVIIDNFYYLFFENYSDTIYEETIKQLVINFSN